MKKGLSAVLAASLAFSAFGSVAFAADSTKDLTALEKFQELVKEGIFDPEGAGNGADLEALTTRAQIAKILVKLLEVEEDASAEKFDDVEADDWFAGYVGALQKAKLIDGVSDEPPLFAPNDNVTIEQFAKLVAIALDLDIDANAKVEGEVSEWAKGYVAAVVKAGYLAPQEDYTAEATREVLVNSAFAAKEIIDQIKAEQQATKIASFAAVGAKKLEVKFSKAVADTSKASVSLKKGSNQVNHKLTWAEDKKSVVIETTTKLTKGEYTVSVSGVEEKALESKVAVEDEKVAKLAFTSDKAPYDRALAEDPDNSNDNQAILFTLKAYNQYNEDITDTTSLSVSASKGQVTSVDSKKGLYRVYSPIGYTLNEPVIINAVHAASGTYATQTYTVSLKSAVADISITKLVAKDGKTLNTTANPDDFWFEVEAKDQYGNPVKAADIGKDVIVSISNPSAAGFKTRTVNGVTYADFEEKDGKSILKLVAGTNANDPNTSATENFGKGTHNIYIISKSSGKQTSLSFEVVDVAVVDTLSISSPDFAVKGEKFELPFTAVDQFGKELTSADALNAGMLSLSVSGAGLSSSNIRFEQDYVNNKARLVIDATNATLKDQSETVFVTGVTKTGKTASLSFTIQAEKKPVTILGVADTKKALAVNATTTIEWDDIQIEDQYGRIKKLSDFAGLQVKVISSDNSKVSTSTAVADPTADQPNRVVADITSADSSENLTLTGVAAGSSEFTLQLYKGAITNANNYIANSDFSFTVKTVELKDIVDYQVGDVAKIYATPAGVTTHAKSLTVNGLLSDGTVVAVPIHPDYYTVTENVYGLDFNVSAAGKLTATAADNASTADVDAIEVGKEKSFTVTVTAFAKDGPKVINKEVIVSRVAPAAETLTVETKTVDTYEIKKESDTVISLSAAAAHALTKEKIASVVTVKDQYGVVLSNPFVTVTVSNFSNSDRDSLGEVIAGDTFYITAITANNKTITLKVYVK